MPAGKHGLKCAALHLLQRRLAYFEVLVAAHVQLHDVAHRLNLCYSFLFIVPSLLLIFKCHFLLAEVTFLFLELVDLYVQLPLSFQQALFPALDLGDPRLLVFPNIFKIVHFAHQVLLALLEYLDFFAQTFRKCTHFLNYLFIFLLQHRLLINIAVPICDYFHVVHGSLVEIYLRLLCLIHYDVAVVLQLLHGCVTLAYLTTIHFYYN